MRRSVRIKNFISKLVISIGIVLLMAAVSSVDICESNKEIFRNGTIGLTLMFIGYKALKF